MDYADLLYSRPIFGVLPERLRSVVNKFVESGFHTRKSLQQQLTQLCDVSQDWDAQVRWCNEEVHQDTISQSLATGPLEDLNLLKNILCRYTEIPEEQIHSETRESIRKELEGLQTPNDAEPTKEFILILREEKFKCCILNWFDSLTRSDIFTGRVSKKTSKLSKEQQGPSHVSEKLIGTTLHSNFHWTKEPFEGRARIATRLVSGLGQKVRTFFPGNPGAVFRLRRPYDFLKSAMLRNQPEHFTNSEQNTIEWMYGLVEDGGAITCLDLKNFTANFPKKQLLALTDRILEIACEQGINKRVVITGPNNQREEQTLESYLLQSFDCILNTIVEGHGPILNGTTLGIPGGWLLCTLGHICLLRSQNITEFKVWGDDVISRSTRGENEEAQRDQKISLSKTTFESRTRATFLKKQLLIEQEQDESGSIFTEDDPVLMSEGSDFEEEDLFGSNTRFVYRIASKAPFPLMAGTTSQSAMSRIVSMVDAAVRMDGMSEDTLEWQKNSIKYFAKRVKNHWFLPTVTQALDNRLIQWSLPVLQESLFQGRDCMLSIPLRQTEGNWNVINTGTLMLEFGLTDKSPCVISDELLKMQLDGQIALERLRETLDLHMALRAHGDILNSTSRDVEAREKLHHFLDRKWVQKTRICQEGTRGVFRFGWDPKKQRFTQERVN